MTSISYISGLNPNMDGNCH